jgi:very-short-patch-repair endonuclease
MQLVREQNTREKAHTHALKGGNSLAKKFPHIAAEWANDLNDLSAAEVTPSNNRYFFWRCEVGHEWRDKVGNRTQLGRGCPECRDFSTSLLELRLLCELNSTSQGYAVLRKPVVGLEADIYLPRLRLIIECDGYPWHNAEKKRKADLAKNRIWKKEGFKVIRVRDKKLKRIQGNVFDSRKGARRTIRKLLSMCSTKR